MNEPVDGHTRLRVPPPRGPGPGAGAGMPVWATYAGERWLGDDCSESCAPRARGAHARESA
jgi:hypothetical protein